MKYLLIFNIILMLITIGFVLGVSGQVKFLDSDVDFLIKDVRNLHIKSDTLLNGQVILAVGIDELEEDSDELQCINGLITFRHFASPKEVGQFSGRQIVCAKGWLFGPIYSHDGVPETLEQFRDHMGPLELPTTVPREGPIAKIGQ